MYMDNTKQLHIVKKQVGLAIVLKGEGKLEVF